MYDDPRQERTSNRPAEMETLSRLQALNPFKPNGISHSYQLDQSIKASKYDQEIPQSHIAGQPMAF